ncbi:MAG TPA: phytanoyl-CoA dioxygenase family protein [Verrucomicrobiae bacterium]|jgi:phytanoyl-CoA hydroxylase|nr:phytanoyl-CoA dioxygenase family protein [Verrucomicrobiae bacterium]
MALTQAQRRRFEEDGFLVVPGFKSPAEIAGLRARAQAIVEAFDPSESVSIFTTNDQAQKSDDYFLTSGDKVRCFFEEDAFDEGGSLRQPKELSINKIGHAMHDLDPVFEEFSRDPRLSEIAADIGLSDPRLYQSMYIFKQPGIGGEVHWHQDTSFFETTPNTVTTFWFALEDADRSNGCLWVQPGGHRTPLRERFVVRDGTARLESIDPTAWPTLEQAVPVEVEQGAMVIFNGLLPHYSAANRSPKSRHAYTLHAVDGRAEYSPLNWLQRGPALPARGFATAK